MAEKVEVTIRIERSEESRMDEIVRALRNGGLNEVESHKRFMIVNGSVDEDAIEELRKVKGVASIRKDRIYKAQTR